MKKLGIIGYGHLGKYLCDKIRNDPNFEIVYVWNRSPINDSNLDSKLILKNLEDFKNYQVDIIVEVSHPIITEKWAEKFLEHSDYLVGNFALYLTKLIDFRGRIVIFNKVGSPTAFADEETLNRLQAVSSKFHRKIFVPCGAFWGANDVKKMAEKNTLTGLRVTMKKHPESLKLEGSLKQKLEESFPLNQALTLYDGMFKQQNPDICRGLNCLKNKFVYKKGPVRQLCKMAPNNVNTMAVGALSALNLGFDGVQACLVADPAY